MATRRSDPVLAEAARALGGRAELEAALSADGLAALLATTRPRLLAAARVAGLTGVSKLRKEPLADRVRAALLELAGAERPAPEGEGPPGSGLAHGGGRRAGGEPGAPSTREGAEAREVGLDPGASAKLALGPAADRREVPAHVPWSYGLDRVTAAAIDPDRLFVYWEVTDPAMDAARAALGPGGSGAWLSLRVYDTTGRLFDGTNAHGYFDHAVDRADRQWFFHLGRPASTAVVEVGMKSAEGFFVRIARSGRVDFPRREPAQAAAPEWMTVRPWSGEVEETHRSPAGRGGWMAKAGPGGGEPWRQPDDSATVRELILRHLREGRWERVERGDAAGERWFETEGRIHWEGPREVTTWEAGPFAYPVEVDPPHGERWEGRGYAWRVGGVTHVVEGPWRVVIRNLGAHVEREAIAAWEIFRSWTSVGGGPAGRSGQDRLRVGASEWVGAAASELRLAGASERWWLGASELAFGGASERSFAGASQWRVGGASERWSGGASEWRLGGASEPSFAGASELALGGASERAWVGGSDWRLGGASDGRVEGGLGPTLPYPPAAAPGFQGE